MLPTPVLPTALTLTHSAACWSASRRRAARARASIVRTWTTNNRRIQLQRRLEPAPGSETDVQSPHSRRPLRPERGLQLALQQQDEAHSLRVEMMETTWTPSIRSQDSDANVKTEKARRSSQKPVELQTTGPHFGGGMGAGNVGPDPINPPTAQLRRGVVRGMHDVEDSNCTLRMSLPGARLPRTTWLRQVRRWRCPT